MGGWGSGRAGRRSARLTVEHVSATSLAGVLRIIPLSERHASERIVGLRLSSTRQPTGGVRWWMHCPRCGRRCAVLYQPATADLACRDCHRLYYRSQRLTTPHRLSYRASKLLARLGCTREDEFFWRPKGMHCRTFDRAIALAEAYDEAAIEAALGGSMPTLLGKIQS